MGQLLIVRHGQADTVGDDYDLLVEKGWQQCRTLGASLASRGIRIDRVVRGGMRRHRESAEALLQGYAEDRDIALDHGWDEFDHLAVLAVQQAPFGGPAPEARAFQAWFELAVARWMCGEHDADYAETFGQFTARVEEALRTAAEGDGCTVVLTSGGAIGWVAASLIGAEFTADDRARLWRGYNTVCANSGLTRVVSGRRGLTLVTFNELAHLDGTELLTYR